MFKKAKKTIHITSVIIYNRYNMYHYFKKYFLLKLLFSQHVTNILEYQENEFMSSKH